MKKLIQGSFIAAALVAVALPAAAHSSIGFYVNVAPPPPRYEVVPASRAGWVWTPGFWEWRHGRYHWVGGAWVRARPGYVYAPARWVVRDGRWIHHRGAWQHDPYWRRHW